MVASVASEQLCRAPEATALLAGELGTVVRLKAGSPLVPVPSWRWFRRTYGLNVSLPGCWFGYQVSY